MLRLHELERTDSLALTQRTDTGRKENNSNEYSFHVGTKIEAA